jgi:hypothetical protein
MKRDTLWISNCSSADRLYIPQETSIILNKMEGKETAGQAEVAVKLLSASQPDPDMTKEANDKGKTVKRNEFKTMKLPSLHCLCHLQ